MSATRYKLRAFTLVELLISIAILSLLVVLLANLLGGVSRAWTSGERQVQTFQDGRAALDLISRELAQAVISPRLQFIQNPGTLDPLLTGTVTQVANTEGVFWQAPLTSNAAGNLFETGYYLTFDSKAWTTRPEVAYQLRRFSIAPEPPNPPVHLYKIFDAPPTYNQNHILPAWIDLGTTNLAPPRTDFEAKSSTIMAGVVALWFRCFDSNGDLIPWLSAADASTDPIRFNSTAHFQPAIPGTPSSFHYTNAASTSAAHRLPSAVEVTLITVDWQTLQRRPLIPKVPAAVPNNYPDVAPSGFGPEDIPNAINWFNAQLVTNNVSTARTFSTRVTLKNSIP